jgi:hypothetical protein
MLHTKERRAVQMVRRRERGLIVLLCGCALMSAKAGRVAITEAQSGAFG